ncbi:Cysteine-rich secretory protein family protein [Lacibacter cauensis]|uniref:Cysteine-rich secretory protein family protein n=1 Tax=Lacibacter cauensis TaxID=510947 RepID=A0A562SNR9_9BACT|nr:CAP domain-containing protein [Lacibacter cauensis]TWI82987.1 Cysteine-rich secretory protein family protein [Lacibacter cauensis]
MFHVKHAFVLAFISICTTGLSQGILTLKDKPFVYSHSYDSSLIKTLNNSAVYKSLSKPEQESVYWLNYFRQNPRRFLNTIIKEFLVQFPEAKSAYTRSLEVDILKAPQTLTLVLPDSGLNTMAAAHALDLKKRNGVISHISSSGKNFVQRIQAAGKYTCGAENIFIGSFNGLESLIALLIDHGVPDKGHRVNILNPRFQLVGVSFIQSSGDKGLLVQDFACH